MCVFEHSNCLQASLWAQNKITYFEIYMINFQKQNTKDLVTLLCSYRVNMNLLKGNIRNIRKRVKYIQH